MLLHSLRNFLVWRSIRGKLLVAFLGLALAPLLLVSLMGYGQAQLMLKQAAYEKLDYVRFIKKTQIEDYFGQRRENLGTLAETVGSLHQDTFDGLTIAQNIHREQVERFFAERRGDVELLANSADVLGLHQALQALHEELNIGPDDPFPIKASAYLSRTARYQPFFADYVESYQYHDLYLMDAEHGHVMFTVKQIGDLGADLAAGELRESGLGQLWRAVLLHGQTTLVDFAPYTPTLDLAAYPMGVLFVGTPLRDNEGQITGVLALSLTSYQFHYRYLLGVVPISTNLHQSRQTYLVAGEPDGRITWRGSNVADAVNPGSDVTDVVPQYVREALAGKTGHELFVGAGPPALVAYEPLVIEGLHWAVISRVDAVEALAPPLGERHEDLLTQHQQLYKYQNLYLISPDGFVFHSAAPSVASRANLLDAPYDSSNLGRLVKRVLETRAFDFADFELWEGKPAAFMAQPIIHKGEVQMIVAAQLSLDDINEIMTRNWAMGQTGETYLVGPDLRLRSDSVFSPETHSVLASILGTVAENGVDTKASRQALAGQSGVEITTDYRGQPVVSAWSPVNVLGSTWAIIAEIDTAEAFARVETLGRALTIVVIAATAGVIIITLWVARTLARPVVQITDAARAVTQGNLDIKAEVKTLDETSVLAEVFNQMLFQLKKHRDHLEELVKERTRDLQIAADVSKQITTELNIDQLLQQVVVLTVKGFNLYAAFVLLLDHEKQQLVNAAGADAAGQLMKGEDFPIISLETEPSIIALTARTHQAVTIDDVSLAPMHLPHPLLPATRSELAIPIMLGKQLLGVFDLQSERVNRFGEEDLRVLTTLAEQIAIAVRNAQLFAEAQTARRAAEAANQAKSTFLANMSHDLRTPLNSILGYAQILKRRTGAGNSLFEGLHTIQHSGEHLLALINDILDLSRVEAGRLELNPAQIHLPTFLQAIASIIQVRAEEKSLLFTYQAADLPVAILADELRLRQVLLNLLGNAVKFTDAGQVTLRVKKKNEGETPRVKDENSVTPLHPSSFILLTFEVEDTGPGILPDDMERIFQPFEQAGEAERRAGGTGLGLAVSRQLVRLMGGELQLKSPVSPAEPMAQGGPGSIFWFEIVVPVPEAEVAPPAPAQSIIGYSGPRRKVLVVDDVAANRMVVLELLTGLGFAVFEAANGQDGLEQAQALRPDVILMDRVMPGLDGLAATRRIREIPFLRETPIISISASVLETDREQCLAAGANAFVSKPIHQEELLAQLGRQLQLTWLYEQPPLEPVEALQVDLPPEEVELLYSLARRGRIPEIRTRLDELEQRGPEYQAFVAQLHRLARHYRSKDIQTLLESYRQE